LAIPEHIRRLRRHVGHDLLLVPSVTAFVRRYKGGVLVVRIRQEDRWTLPGGLLEPGENPVDALIRETHEESGLDVEPISVLGVFGGPDGFRRTYSNGDRIECLDILFECRVVGGFLKPGDSEVAEVGFLSPQQLHSWAYPIPVLSVCEAADNHCTLATIAGQPTCL
jgi:ADP-ribose pyrophosphatase YjhB (NUDIX family)